MQVLQSYPGGGLENISYSIVMFDDEYKIWKKKDYSNIVFPPKESYYSEPSHYDSSY